MLWFAAHRARRASRALVLIMPVVDGQPLRILHATRAPVGGIFRHILDLANGQADRGHHVGIIADSLTGGERAEQALAEIAPRAQARRSPHGHSPRAAAERSSGVGAIPAHDPRTEAGRAARPRRQGRRLHASADRVPRQDPGLHAAWRLAALSAVDAEGQHLRPRRTRADERYRPVPVRKRVCARHLSAHHRHAEGTGALRVQRRHRR